MPIKDQMRAAFNDLAPFQKRTAIHAFRRLQQKPHRFLVADEVGLGKTFVARGIIAQTVVEKINQKNKHINIVYICSNQSIAAQNIKTLDLTHSNYQSTRLTRLIEAVDLLGGKNQTKGETKINFISFTPSTSFKLHRATGTKEERAILWRLVDYYAQKENLQVDPKCLQNFFQCGAGETSWKSLISSYGNKLWLADLSRKKKDKTYLLSSIRDAFLEIAKDCIDIDKINTYTDDAKGEKINQSEDLFSDAMRRERNEIIGKMRHLLAKCCLQGLRPSLVIMDEFQRFKSLLYDDTTQQSGLMNELLQQDATQQAIYFLFLSATPYHFNPHGVSLTEDTAKDFQQLLSFLFDSQNTSLPTLFKQYRGALMSHFSADNTTAINAIKRKLETTLKKVMVRTERVRHTADSYSMMNKDNTILKGQLHEADVRHYLQTEKLFRSFKVGDPVSFWKSAPYVLHFMKKYVINKKFDEFLASGNPMETKVFSVDNQKIKALRNYQAPKNKHQLTATQHPYQIDLYEQIQQYQEIDYQHALVKRFSETILHKDNRIENWKLLWIPPTVSYWQHNRETADANRWGYAKSFQRADITKALVFSGWNMVPDVLTGLLSYEAERRMIGKKAISYNKLKEHRTKIANLEGKTFNFISRYPCVELAKIDIWDHYRETNLDDICMIEDLRNWLHKKIETLEITYKGEVKSLRAWCDTAEEKTKKDSKWYIAAPLLLDGKTQSVSWLKKRKNDLEGDNTENTSKEFDRYFKLLDGILSGEEELGPVPRDLIDILVDTRLGAPATVALHLLQRHRKNNDKTEDTLAFAFRMGNAFHSLFDKPANRLLLTQKRKKRYWHSVLQYCIAGNLQALLDEMFFLSSLDRATNPKPVVDKIITQITPNKPSVQSNFYALQKVSPKRLRIDKKSMKIRADFAQRFAKMDGENDKQQVSLNRIRESFNSPFRPFVLSSTSVGQEGLNFHSWCHTVVHWNLPNNPVDLEQREGRVHRYQGHAIRRNVVRRFYREGLQSYLHNARSNIWIEMFSKAKQAFAATDKIGLYPNWLMELDPQQKTKTITINRWIMSLPYSQEEKKYKRLQVQLALYRLAFGQPNQKEFMDFLINANVDVSTAKNIAKQFSIDLQPDSSLQQADVFTASTSKK